MTKPLLVVTLALALAAAACGALGPTAATVNGSRIAERAVDEELVQIADNKPYRQALGLPSIEGEGGKGTFRADFAAQVLTLQIYYDLVRQELARRKLTLTDADLAKAGQEVADSLSVDRSGSQPDVATGQRILAQFSPGYRDELIRRRADVEKLQSTMETTDTSDAAVQRYYETHRDEFAQVCVLHVLVNTKEEADRVKAQLAAGADFRQLAEAQSKDPSAKQNRGDLGCASPRNYVKEFADALGRQPVGQIGDPVKTSFGWHVIQVYDRKISSLSEVAGRIRQQLSQGGARALNEWLRGAVERATVSVNPKFGRLERSTQAGELSKVVPPELPQTRATLPGLQGSEAPAPQGSESSSPGAAGSGSPDERPQGSGGP